MSVDIVIRYADAAGVNDQLAQLGLSWLIDQENDPGTLMVNINEQVCANGDRVITLRVPDDVHEAFKAAYTAYLQGGGVDIALDHDESETFPTDPPTYEQIDTGEVDGNGDPIYVDGEELFFSDPRPSYDIDSVDIDGNPIVISQQVGGISR